MDIRIKEAANQHHPAYDDKAWEKMHKLLDKHLPQKKDRKRWFLFLLLFLLLDTALLLFIVKPWKNNSTNTAQNNTSTTKPSAANETTRAADNTVTVSPTDQTGIETGKDQPANTSLAPQQANANSSTVSTIPTSTPGIQAKPSNNTTSTVSGTNDPALASKHKNRGADKGRFATLISNPNAVSDNNNDLAKAIKQDPVSKKEDNRSTSTGTDWSNEPANKTALVKIPETNSHAIAKEELTQDKKTITPDKKEEEKNKASNDKRKKISGGFGNNFGLTVSVGAETNFVSLNNTGKITPLYGAGLSYTVAKRLVVRAGFYVTKKIYSATPDQYNNTTYPYLDNIKADCKVYVVPVSAGYSFGQRKKHSWFGNVGIASVFMKKEVYDYEYKLPGGQQYAYQRTVDNENKHYFSILSLSAGYQRNLGNKVSIAAEPFVNLPLKGIGLGKIKLNSAGALLSVTIKPFAKKK